MAPHAIAKVVPQGGRGLSESPPRGGGLGGGNIDRTLAKRLDAEADVITAPTMASWGEGHEAEPAPLVASVDLGVAVPWEGMFLMTVLAGGLVCWGLAAVRIYRFHRLLGDLDAAPGALQASVDALAEELKLGRAPRVRLAAGRIPPMLWAFGGRARLLIPADLWPSLSLDQQTALLTHELAHLKRKDHWVRWLDLAVAGLYWWNPVVWWARRALREAEEQCCDAWAVGAMPRRARTYAAALMAALDFISGAPTAEVAAASAVIGGRRHVTCLQRRMRMIVRAKTPRGLSWAGRLGVLGLAALILPLAPIWAQDSTRTRARLRSRPRDPGQAG